MTLKATEKMKKNRLLTFVFIILMTCISYGQSFLNGSFEINSASWDQINLTNAQYNSIMTNSVSFGSFGDMDVIISNTYCISPAQQGNWYVALTGGGTDAISLKLSSPLVIGQNYTITFYDRYSLVPDTAVYPFQIGQSTTDSTFGTLLYTAPSVPDSCSWTLRSFSFVAQNNGQYITVKISDGNEATTWGHCDNFNIWETTSTENALPIDHFQIFPNPALDEINIKQIDGFNEFKSVRILTILGEEIFKSKYIEKINISAFSNGTYILEISTDQNTFFHKFIKQ